MTDTWIDERAYGDPDGAPDDRVYTWQCDGCGQFRSSRSKPHPACDRAQAERDAGFPKL